jgi:hypothetical protein
MTPRRAKTLVALSAVTAGFAFCASPPPASALDLAKPLCSAAGIVSGLVGKVCAVAGHPGRILDAGKKLVHGKLGGAAKVLLGDGTGGASAATRAIGLAAVGAWVIGGASFALRETAKVLSATTSPRLTSTWFSSAYWRMAAIAALLTLPFLFAAAIQAVMRSDLALLGRAALGYLPLSMLAVAIAAPLTTLLLAASDQMSSVVSAAAGNAGGHFLDSAGLKIAGIATFARAPFFAFLVGLFTVAGTLTLWLELLMRQAAVYVIVLMLPVVFASLVWPARRVWAIRATELLVALILSKFAIVAVLALGGAALDHGLGSGVAGLLAGLVLVLLGAFAPWALLRLLPLHELASGAVGSLRAEARPAIRAGQLSDAIAVDGDHWIRNLHSRMSREAEGTTGLASGRAAGNDDLVLAAGDSGHNSGFDATEGGSGQPEAENTPETASVAEPGPPPRAGAAAAETHPAEVPGSPRPTPSHAGRGTPSGPANPSRSTGLEAPELVLGLDGAWFRPDRPEDQQLDPFWSLPDEPTAEDGNRRDAEGVADEDDELPPRQRPEDVA